LRFSFYKSAEPVILLEHSLYINLHIPAGEIFEGKHAISLGLVEWFEHIPRAARYAELYFLGVNQPFKVAYQHVLISRILIKTVNEETEARGKLSLGQDVPERGGKL
jgi:hypothetical protein